MSIANLKKMKKELLLMRKNSNKALDGLFLIDLSKIEEGRISPINEAPEGMDIEVIGANIDDILVCGGTGYKPVLIINDVHDDDIDVSDDIDVFNIVPARKDL